MGFNHGQDSFMWPRLMPSQGHDFELSAISVPRSWEMRRNLWDSLPPPTLGMYQDQGSTHVPRQLIVWVMRHGSKEANANRWFVL